MQNKFEEHMTNEMIQEIQYIHMISAYEIKLCVKHLLACHEQAILDLPATTASGKPVVHGARLEMFSLRDYWIQRLDMILERVSREEKRAFLHKMCLPKEVLRKITQ